MAVPDTPKREKIDEVSNNKVWREHCQRETKLLQVNEKFKMSSPQRVQICAEKPTAARPNLGSTSRGEMEKAQEELQALCSTFSGCFPPEPIFDKLPLTSNAQYGAFIGTLTETPLLMFEHKLKHSDATSFAAAYSSATGGQSVFAKLKVLDKGGQPIQIQHPWQ